MRKVIRFEQKEIVYHVYGNGEPVVLLHGFGEDHSVFQGQIEFLKKAYTVVSPDIPGSGESEFIPGELNMEDYADCLHQIIDNENISKFTLIGHSMGGYITLAYAEKYPERLKGLGLFHSTSAADDEEKKKTRTKAIDFIKKNGAAKFLEEAIPKLFSDESRRKSPEMINKLIARYSSFDPQALIQYYGAMMRRPDRSELLKKIKNPVLFIAGEHDQTIPLNKMLELVILPEFSYIHICKHSGHMGMLEEAEFCNQIIEAYLSKI